MNYRELTAALTPLHGAGEARAIVRLVMEERFGLSQTDLLLGKDTALSANDREEMEKIASRLLAGEPVQYVLGFSDFCGHRFRVTPDVLIPRPETEELTRLAIAENPQSSNNLLDLCTGSGCIATSLALAFPKAHVVGVDVSEAALAVARENATSLGAENVEFVRQDVLSSQFSVQARSVVPSEPPNFQLLVSNPPYVRESEAAGMSSTVLDHEPHLALFVPDADPLLFYRTIAHIARQVLCPGGLLLFEVNQAFGNQTCQLLEQLGFDDVSLRKDQFGRPRMVRATWPSSD